MTLGSDRTPPDARPGPGRARPLRRRQLLAAAALVTLARPATAAAALQGDGAILDALIAREEAAALAHRVGGTGVSDHESAHARALRTELAALGREGPPRPGAIAELDGAARRLAEGGGTRAQIELEESLLAAYRDALLELAEPSILQTAASILASHAQHRALLD